jgi:molybdopterin-guanine dinucleotide biosynthesis protein B
VARIISIVGLKNAGKTTLAVALSSEFARKGRRVMMLKQAEQPNPAEVPGGETGRYFVEGKSERVLVAGPTTRTMFDRGANLTDPEALARRYLSEADIVLVEGFPGASLPKIEVYRRESGPAPVYRPDLPGAADWLAVVTDDEKLQAPIPVLRFRDTMWLHLLASLAWDRAKPLTG